MALNNHTKIFQADNQDQRALDSQRVVDSYIRNNIPITPLHIDEGLFFAILSLQLGPSTAQYSVDVGTKVVEAGGSRSDWHYWYCKWVVWEHEHAQ